MKKIVIPDDYQAASANIRSIFQHPELQVHLVGDIHRDPQADALLQQADGLVLIRERTTIDAAFLQRAPQLRVISQTGKIARNIDLALCRQNGVDVIEGRGSPVAPAELAWLLIQSAVRQWVPAVQGMQAGKWQVNIGDTVAGKSLGIIGFGAIGKRVAKYADAFDMSVQVWGTERAQDEARAMGYGVPVSRKSFFSTSDIVTIHQRLSHSSEGNITVEDLLAMQKKSILVNTARAELIAKGALEKALDAGTPGFAALDVYEQEPIYDSNHPLLKRSNVLCSPHLGYVAKSSYQLYLEIAFDNLVRYFSGDHSQVLN